MKILITGGKGLLGQKLTEILSKNYTIEPIDLQELDITDKQATLNYIKKSSPSILIHTAALTNVDLCETNKELAQKVNVEGTQNLIEALISLNTKAKFIYFSTDFIFDGKKGDYTEEDIPNPQNEYAKTKFKGELLVKNSSLPYLIARLSYLYGYNKGAKNEGSIINLVKRFSEEGKPLPMIADRFGTPTFIDDIAYAMQILIKKNITGVYHIAGPERVSMYEYALKIRKAFNLNLDLKKDNLDSFLKKGIEKAPRPKDSSLNTSKLQSLGIKMSSLQNALEKIKKIENETA